MVSQAPLDDTLSPVVDEEPDGAESGPQDRSDDRFEEWILLQPTPGQRERPTWVDPQAVEHDRAFQEKVDHTPGEKGYADQPEIRYPRTALAHRLHQRI